MEVISLLALWVTGKVAVDLRPVKGATMLAWAGVAMLTVATVADEIIEEAITSFLLLILISPLIVLTFARAAKLLLSLHIYMV